MMTKKLKYAAVFAVVFTILNIVLGVRVSAGVPEETLNSVVRVLAVEYGRNGQIESYNIGSGFAVGEEGKSPEYFITSARIVTNNYQNNVSEYYILTDEAAVTINEPDSGYDGLDGEEIGKIEYEPVIEINTAKAYKCDIVYVADEDEPDVAVLRTIRKVKGRKPARLLSAETAGRGSKVYTVSFSGRDIPFEVEPEQCQVTTGSIAKFTQLKAQSCKLLEIEAKALADEAGGPIITDDGAFVGINTGEVIKETKNSCRYYAISSEYLFRLLDSEDILYIKFDEEQITDADKKPVPVGIIVAIVVMSLAIIAVIIVAAVTVSSGKGKSSKIKPTGPTAKIVCTGGALCGLVYYLGENAGSVTIGRNSECEIIYPNETRGISRKHVKLYILNGRLYITDLGSTAGTQIIGEGPIFSGRAVEIGLYQKFCLGDVTNVFEVQPSDYQ